MFPSRDLPAIVDDNNNNNAPAEPDHAKESKEKRKSLTNLRLLNTSKYLFLETFPITICRQLCGTGLCLVLILLIIAIAILIGYMMTTPLKSSIIFFYYSLLSVFIPKSIDGISVNPIVEKLVLTLVLPIAQNSSNISSLNNNSLIADDYLNYAQRNILKACVSNKKTAQITSFF